MAGKVIDIHDPVSKDEIELTDKESKQYQKILNTAIKLEESYNKVVAEIQEDYKKFLKSNEQHYKKYKELVVELKKGKITTDSFTSIDNLSYNTIQTELIQTQDKFQEIVVHRHRLEKAKVEYNRIKEDIDRSKLIVATLKQQIKKPPHNITDVSLAYLQRDLKKYQYHTNLLERRRTRRYKICRKEKPPIEVESDTEYSDGGYSTAEDLKDKECLPHRYKLIGGVDRVAHPTQPRLQTESEETKPKEVVEVVELTNPTVVVPNPRDLNLPDPLDREVNMDQHRLDERVRELIERGS